MSDASCEALSFQTLSGPDTVSEVRLDTTGGSIAHEIYRRLALTPPPNHLVLAKVYCASIAVTFVPLLIFAIFSGNSLVAPTPAHPLPFFYDWNMLFMFLVSFPCLVALVVTDQDLLTRALTTVRRDGTIIISPDDERRLAIRWFSIFKTTNQTAQVLGLLVGGIVAYANYRAYVPASVGYWISDNGVMHAVGWVFLYCVFSFYFLVPTYVLRNIVIAFLLADTVAHAQLHLLPLHPDGAGGLRPVGRVGLRNQYALSLTAVNIILLITVSRHYLHVQPMLNDLMLAAVVAYIVLGPIVFTAPLLPFRTGMIRTKERLLGEVAARIRVELDRLRAKLPSGTISKEDEELVDRLQKIGAVIDELPVWPFDAGTLRKFLTAYIIPLVGVIPVVTDTGPVIRSFLVYAHILPP